jgi:uncharacterized protein (UPF0264 family)
MPWQGLLVSVRTAAEAEEALAGGASIVDVKEPLKGALGRAEPAVISGIAAAVGSRVPWTMACGELAEWRGEQEFVPRRVAQALLKFLRGVISSLPAGAACPAALKAGLAGVPEAGWRQALADVAAGLPEKVELVAVAYADWQVALAPRPEEVIAAAVGCGCSTLLLDTFDKAGPGLLEQEHGAREVAGWVAAARTAGLEVALAGRLTLAEIPAVMRLAPNVVALRSAVCFNGLGGSARLGTVQRHLVRLAAQQCAVGTRCVPG